jgi:tetratricopeptide (TPR) repeat protein
MQDGESAKNEAHAYIALHPKSYDGHIALAIAHYACREYPQALIELKECMEFAPDGKLRQNLDMMELFIHREHFQKEELWSRCCYCGGACENPLACSACLYIHYCSNDCQAKHWKGKHKQLCMSRFAHNKNLVDETSSDSKQYSFADITPIVTLMNQLDECVALGQFDKLIEKARELLRLMNKDDPIRAKVFGYFALGFARLNRYEDAVIYANKMLQESHVRDSIPRKVSNCNAAANIYTLLGDNTSAVALRYDSIRTMMKYPELDHSCNLDDCILAYCYGLMDESFDGIYRDSKFLLSDTHYLVCTAKIFLQKAKILDTSMRFGF